VVYPTLENCSGYRSNPLNFVYEFKHLIYVIIYIVSIAVYAKLNFKTY
jgi:hypothetical protein